MQTPPFSHWQNSSSFWRPRVFCDRLASFGDAPSGGPSPGYPSVESNFLGYLPFRWRLLRGAATSRLGRLRRQRRFRSRRWSLSLLPRRSGFRCSSGPGDSRGLATRILFTPFLFGSWFRAASTALLLLPFPSVCGRWLGPPFFSRRVVVASDFRFRGDCKSVPLSLEIGARNTPKRWHRCLACRVPHVGVNTYPFAL